MAYQHFDLTPLTGVLGATVRGVDLGGALANAVWDDIHGAFLEHLVLAFEDQVLGPASHLAFARRFGPPNLYKFAVGMPDYPEVVELIKEPSERRNFGGVWHSDQPYLSHPPIATTLRALEVPAVGGDTLFANMYVAYETLSDGLRASLEGRRALNSADVSGKGRKRGGYQAVQSTDVDPTLVTAVHPVVRVHPETGRKLLYVNGVHTKHFEGMSVEESRPLLRFLSDHAVRPEHTCRVRWKPGMLTIWDNRCTQHMAVNDYHGVRRHMHRVTVSGDAPR